MLDDKPFEDNAQVHSKCHAPEFHKKSRDNPILCYRQCTFHHQETLDIPLFVWLDNSTLCHRPMLKHCGMSFVEGTAAQDV